MLVLQGHQPKQKIQKYLALSTERARTRKKRKKTGSVAHVQYPREAAINWTSRLAAGAAAPAAGRSGGAEAAAARAAPPAGGSRSDPKRRHGQAARAGARSPSGPADAGALQPRGGSSRHGRRGGASGSGGVPGSRGIERHVRRVPEVGNTTEVLGISSVLERVLSERAVPAFCAGANVARAAAAAAASLGAAAKDFHGAERTIQTALVRARTRGEPAALAPVIAKALPGARERAPQRRVRNRRRRRRSANLRASARLRGADAVRRGAALRGSAPSGGPTHGTDGRGRSKAGGQVAGRGHPVGGIFLPRRRSAVGSLHRGRSTVKRKLLVLSPD